MKLLVVGSGGREHALAWKLKQSPKVTELFIAPGNAGTARIGQNIDVRSVDDILNWLETHPTDLVVVGPDALLAEGLVDRAREKGIRIFGPTKAAAEIEWSKSYAKQLMREEGIPTARYKVFATKEDAEAYVRTLELFPVVIKPDGLAVRSGVVIAKTQEEALQALEDMVGKELSENTAGRIVVEDYLEGFEMSVHAFCDGETAVLFPASKDHKRAYDGDQGPNTGGMGTIAPVPLVSEGQMELIRERIVLPTLAALKKRGRPFTGILFPGIMLTENGPYVIEFNARFGDPETQSYVRILESDLFDILYACTTGTLKDIQIVWTNSYACCVVLASSGYPGTFPKGMPIDLPPDVEDVVVFHAGTTLDDAVLVTDGGRVLGVTATGVSLAEARTKAYEAADRVSFEGKYFRRDIGGGL